MEMEMFFMYTIINKNMKKFYIIMSFLTLANVCLAQRIMNSTFSSLGYSSQVKSNYYAHVLTQSSVQGTYVASNGTVVRQGFKQGMFGKYFQEQNQTMPVTTTTTLADPILLNVYPNPFADNVTLRMDKVSEYSTNVVLYDLSGNIIVQKDFPAYTQEFNLTNLGHLRISKYFIKVNQNNQSKTISLLKN